MKKRPTLGWAIRVIFGWMYRLFVTRPEGQSHLRIHRRAVWGRWWRGMKIPPLLAMFLSKYWLGSPSLTLKIQRHTACRKNLYTFFYLTLNITSGLSLMRKPSKVCVNIGKFYLDFWKNMSFLGLPSSWSKRSTGFFFNESIPKIHQRIFFSCARRPKTSGAVATVPKLPVIEVFSASMPNHRSPRVKVMPIELPNWESFGTRVFFGGKVCDVK